MAYYMNSKLFCRLPCVGLSALHCVKPPRLLPSRRFQFSWNILRCSQIIWLLPTEYYIGLRKYLTWFGIKNTVQVQSPSIGMWWDRFFFHVVLISAIPVKRIYRKSSKIFGCRLLGSFPSLPATKWEERVKERKYIVSHSVQYTDEEARACWTRLKRWQQKTVGLFSFSSSANHYVLSYTFLLRIYDNDLTNCNSIFYWPQEEVKGGVLLLKTYHEKSNANKRGKITP